MEAERVRFLARDLDAELAEVRTALAALVGAAAAPAATPSL
jgi:hypothetical protein